MDRFARARIDSKMLHRATVAIVFGLLYVVLGFWLWTRPRHEWLGASGLTAVGTPGTESFAYLVDLPLEPVRVPTTGFLDTSGSGTHPLTVYGWLGLLHSGIPVHRTQITVTWRGDDGTVIPITTKQQWDTYVPLKSLPATTQGSIHASDEGDTILEMLRNRQTTMWLIAPLDVALLLAQAVCGVVCITACVQWYRLLKTLGHVEAGGCITCGYPIAPNTGTCPECGHVHGA